MVQIWDLDVIWRLYFVLSLSPTSPYLHFFYNPPGCKWPLLFAPTAQIFCLIINYKIYSQRLKLYADLLLVYFWSLCQLFVSASKIQINKPIQRVTFSVGVKSWGWSYFDFYRRESRSEIARAFCSFHTLDVATKNSWCMNKIYGSSHHKKFEAAIKNFPEKYLDFMNYFCL